LILIINDYGLKKAKAGNISGKNTLIPYIARNYNIIKYECINQY